MLDEVLDYMIKFSFVILLITILLVIMGVFGMIDMTEDLWLFIKLGIFVFVVCGMFPMGYRLFQPTHPRMTKEETAELEKRKAEEPNKEDLLNKF